MAGFEEDTFCSIRGTVMEPRYSAPNTRMTAKELNTPSTPVPTCLLLLKVCPLLVPFRQAHVCVCERESERERKRCVDL